MRAILAVLLFSLVACSEGFARRNSADPDGNLIDYQFIDADTMKPISGAYANIVWVTPTPPGKVNGSQCVRAALLRSDANGWVKMDGPKGSIIDLLNFMVPGYESLKLTYELEPMQTVHVLSVSHAEYAQFPAWAKALQGLGYQVIDIKENSNVLFRKNYDHVPKSNDPWTFTGAQRYFVKLRSFPSEAASSFPNIGNACGPEGENFGLSESERLETNTKRGLEAKSELCDEKWDGATGRQPYGELTTALWLVTDPMDTSSWRQFASVVPSYPPVIGAEASRAFSKDERLKFCTWIQPYTEKLR